MQTVFGAASPPVSGLKGAFGHAMGAATAIEAAVCVAALAKQIAPADDRAHRTRVPARPGARAARRAPALGRQRRLRLRRPRLRAAAGGAMSVRYATIEDLAAAIAADDDAVALARHRTAARAASTSPPATPASTSR